MAKNKENPSNEPEKMEDEDDFVELTSGGPLVYTKPSQGQVIRGRLLGRFKRLGETGKGNPYYFKVKTYRPTLAFKNNRETKEAESFQTTWGDVVMVDERETLKVLQDLAHRAESGEIVEVLIKCLGKQTSRNGMTFWAYDVKYKVLEQEPTPID